MKIFRVSYLAVNARHMILVEQRKPGINEDRVPDGCVRLKMCPGEDIVLGGDDAAEFLRQFDEAYPRPSREQKPRAAIVGQPVDPETGEPLPSPGDSVRQG